jgi:hypothetical protein
LKRPAVFPRRKRQELPGRPKSCYSESGAWLSPLFPGRRESPSHPAGHDNQRATFIRWPLTIQEQYSMDVEFGKPIKNDPDVGAALQRMKTHAHNLRKLLDSTPHLSPQIGTECCQLERAVEWLEELICGDLGAVAVERRDLLDMQHAVEQMELGQMDVPADLLNLHWLSIKEIVARLARFR